MDLKTLVKKRASFKAKLTQFTNYLAVAGSCSTLSSLQISELLIRLTKIEEFYSEFDAIQIQIESIPDVPEDAEAEFRKRESFESQYFQAIAAARDMLSRNGASADIGAGAAASDRSVSGSGTVRTNHNTGVGMPSLKLPTIHLPVFSGRYQNWLEFHDTFNSLIHSNDTIPKINKFHYLRASLKESAAQVISSLDFSADNYDIAWQSLCDRYHNNRLLINNHIQALFDLETIHKESSKALRNIVDTLNKNLRALNTLNLPTQHWDMLIIHMVAGKLDSSTTRDWEAHRNFLKELPTLCDFTNFLKNRADLLETMEEAHPKRRHSDITHVRPKSFMIHPHSPHTQMKHYTSSHSCPLCKGNHAIFQCSNFKSLSIDTRIQKAKQLKLCMNCLRRGHEQRECRLGPCTVCTKPHNTMLHQDMSREQAVNSPASVDKKPCVVLSAQTHLPTTDSQLSTIHTQKVNNNVVLSATATTQNCVILSTALVSVTGQDGQKHTIRALLYNGSTSSFITESLCEKLKLLTHTTSTSVEGLNGQHSHITKSCNIQINSLTEPFTLDDSFFVVPHITQSLPTTPIDVKSLNIPKEIRLADPSFFKSSEIDILLSADIFWTILGTKRISLGKGKPTLHETKLGYLVSGSVKHTTINPITCTHTVHYRSNR